MTQDKSKLFKEVFGSVSLESAWKTIGLWPDYGMLKALELKQFDSGFLSASESRLCFAFVIYALKSRPEIFSQSHFAMGLLGMPEFEIDQKLVLGASKIPRSLSNFSVNELEFLRLDLECLKRISHPEVQFCRPEQESLLRILRTQIKLLRL